MALVKCVDCNHDLSTEAVACPHCGRPNQPSKAQPAPSPAPRPPPSRRPRDPNSRIGCLTGLVIAVGLFTCWSVTRDKPSPPKPQPAPTNVSLKAQVRGSAGQLLITNGDSFAWEDCDLTLNP